MGDLWWLLGALVALAAFALGALASAIAYFNRDPERKVSTAPNSILSAADGWITAVRKLTYDDLLKQTGMDDLQPAILTASWNRVSNFWLVSVFMPVMDVHVNRAPLTGIVTAIVHRPGEFRPLSETATTNPRNERNAMFIQGESISVALVQIAGMLARRIMCRVSPGDAVKQGDRIGWIRLGSQVDVVFPALDHMAIEVRRHSRVKAGMDQLASFNHVTELEREGISGPSYQSRISRLAGVALERLLNWTLMSYLYIRLGVRLIYSRVKNKARSEGA